jgi:hypothetical protein
MEVIGSRHIVMWKSLTSIRGPYAGLRRISLDHQLFPWLRNTSCPSFLGSSISRMRRKVEFCATWILDHSFVSATNGVSCFVHDLSSYSFVRFNCAYLCVELCCTLHLPFRTGNQAYTTYSKTQLRRGFKRTARNEAAITALSADCMKYASPPVCLTVCRPCPSMA